MLFSCQIPWPYFMKDSDEIQNGYEQCMNTTLLRGTLIFLQLINIALWICRSQFSKRSHIAHFICANLLMILALMPSPCEVMTKQMPFFVYSVSMIFQIAIFSKMTALTQLHLLLAILIAIIVHLIVLGVIQKQKQEFYDIYVSINSFLVTVIFTYSSNVLKFHDKTRGKKDSSNCQSQSQELQSVPSMFLEEQTPSFGGELQQDKNKKISETERGLLKNQIMTQDTSTHFERQIMTNVLLQQLPQGVAITKDFFNNESQSESEDFNSDDNDIDIEGQTERSYNESQSSQLIFKEIQKWKDQMSLKQLKLQQRQKLLTKFDENIFFSNDQIFKIIIGLSQNFEKVPEIIQPKSQCTQSYQDYRIFIRRCLYPLAQPSINQSGNESPCISELRSTNKNNKNKFESLHSLARRYANFQGYFKTSHRFFQQHDENDGEVSDKNSRKFNKNNVIKVEIKRIMINEVYHQVFLINDISDFLKNQHSKMKSNFSKQLTATLCHEVMTPLNCIINISDILKLSSDNLFQKLQQLFTQKSIDKKKRNQNDVLLSDLKNSHELIHTVQSSSLFMKFMLMSQMSSTKHGMKQLMVNFDSLEIPIQDLLTDFMKPYRQLANQKNLQVILKVTNDMPENFYTDWTIYTQILFHIMGNAFKFSQHGGKITIFVTYCPLKVTKEFHYASNKNIGILNQPGIPLKPRSQNTTSLSHFGKSNSQSSPKSNLQLAILKRSNSLKTDKLDFSPQKMVKKQKSLGNPPSLVSDDILDLNGLGYLLTVVEDQGCGINKNQISDLFQMFNNATQQFFKTKGIGLGLTTARRLTQSMLGGIHLSSEVQKGTTVGFSVMTMDKNLRINSQELKNKFMKHRKVNFSFQGISKSVKSSSPSQLNDSSPTDQQGTPQSSYQDPGEKNKKQLTFSGQLGNLLKSKQFSIAQKNQQQENKNNVMPLGPNSCFYTIFLEKQLFAFHCQWQSLEVLRCSQQEIDLLSKITQQFDKDKQLNLQINDQQESTAKNASNQPQDQIKKPQIAGKKIQILENKFQLRLGQLQVEEEKDLEQKEDKADSNQIQLIAEDIEEEEEAQQIIIEHSEEKSSKDRNCLNVSRQSNNSEAASNVQKQHQSFESENLGESERLNDRFGGAESYRQFQQDHSKVKVIGLHDRIGCLRDDIIRGVDQPMKQKSTPYFEDQFLKQAQDNQVRLNTIKDGLLSLEQNIAKNKEKALLKGYCMEQKDQQIVEEQKNSKISSQMSFMDSLASSQQSQKKQEQKLFHLKNEEEVQSKLSDEIQQDRLQPIPFFKRISSQAIKKQEKIEFQSGRVFASKQNIIRQDFPNVFRSKNYDYPEKKQELDKPNQIIQSQQQNFVDQNQQQIITPVIEESKSNSDKDSFEMQYCDQSNNQSSDQCCSKAEVLLVDDVLFNLMPLKSMIEFEYEKKCDEAVNGQIAVDMYYKNMTKTCCNVHYQVIFTDINMPEMDGYAEAIQIKNHEKDLKAKNALPNEIIIVMVSSYDQQDYIDKAFNCGASEFIAKPVNIEQVRQICKKISAFQAP